MSRHTTTESASDDRSAPRRRNRARRGLTIVAMTIALPGIIGTASASARTAAAAGACYLDGVETSNGGEVRMPSGTIKTCRDGNWVAN